MNNALKNPGEPPRLFGTSGIRGVYTSGTSYDSVRSYTESNLICPAFAFRFGEALAHVYRLSGNTNPVEIWQDVRDSGIMIANAIAVALEQNHIRIIYRGITPTTLYTSRNDHWVIVVTASHNPSEYNGIKVFHCGRPLERFHEEHIETLMSTFSDTSMEFERITAAVPDSQTLKSTRDLQMLHLKTHIPLKQLQTDPVFRNLETFVPLDLAFGASACSAGPDGTIADLSPQISIFLKSGLPVIGYGCVQDSQRTNHRIGAAYAYGETPHIPAANEMTAFSEGRYGYGVPAARILFLPPDLKETFPGSCSPVFEKICYERPIDPDEHSGWATILHIDHPSMPPDTKTRVEMFLQKRKPLPGLMVDCDADRILVTTPSLSHTSIPYLTGDAMIRLFAEYTQPETYSEIAFTVESGFSLEVALEKLRRHHQNEGYAPFSLRKVTVGDRAIIDVFMASGSGKRLGGEPSGHIIFSDCDGYRTSLTDDPFVTYFRLLELTRLNGYDLDTMCRNMFAAVPEVFCARKPDANASTGLSHHEKTLLELWQDTTPGHLSGYARLFIPGYIQDFCNMLSQVFDWGNPEHIRLTSKWKQLTENNVVIPQDGWDMPIADIQFRHKVAIRATLYLDTRCWAGPEVIRIGFLAGKPEGRWNRFGEGVFRNSGTSPKNAGYHKLWIDDPVFENTVDSGVLENALTRLAQKRAAFTDHYVQTFIRGKPHPGKL